MSNIVPYPQRQSSPSQNQSSGETGAPAARLREVESVFRRWLHMPDMGLLHVVLGTVAANMMSGDAVWLMLISPPGSGKTEVLQSTSLLPNMHVASTITEAGLLSGTSRKSKTEDATGGLLPQVGKFGVLVLKDFTSILKMHPDKLASLLAALREIYDGSWVRHLGTDGGKTYEWTGKLGVIAGCTQAIDTHHGVIASLGERFLYYRVPPIDPDEQGERALENAGHQEQMRMELACAVLEFFVALEVPKTPPTLRTPEKRRLTTLATLAARCRSAVERDGNSREIELVPDPEAPGRIVTELGALLAGLTAIGVEREEAWSIVVKVALDGMPTLRRTTFDLLVQAQEPLTTSEIAHQSEWVSEQAVRRALQDLAAHGIIRKESGGDGKPDLWSLSEWARDRYHIAISDVTETTSNTSFVVDTVPEISQLAV
jgi:hypothetical protein